MSLLQSLIGSNPVRPDDKRILPVRRPFFLRPRDVFEIIVALGEQATMQSIFQCTEFRLAEPRAMNYLVLNRWPTEEELAALPDPYKPVEHLRALLTGQEFRASLFRRICDCYPERPRIFFVHIPRCAGSHLVATARDMHPIFSRELAEYRPRDENRFIPALGALLGRFTLTRTIMTVGPHVAPFIQGARPESPNPSFAAAGMDWTVNAPPRRANDRLCTVIREPRGLILSQVNAIVDALLQPASADTPDIAAWRKRLPASGAAPGPEECRQIARAVMAALPVANPICSALSDGTAEGALRVVRHQDIEIAAFTRYMDWVKYTWDVEPNPPMNAATPHLKPADLTGPDRDRLQSLCAEDQIFYAAFEAAEAQIGDLRYSVRGREM